MKIRSRRQGIPPADRDELRAYVTQLGNDSILAIRLALLALVVSIGDILWRVFV